MQPHLPAQRKLRPKVFAKIVAGFSGAIFVFCISMTAMGNLTPRQLAERSALVVLFGATAILSYVRLAKVAPLAKPERLPLINAALSAVAITLFCADLTVLFPSVTLPWWQVPMMFGLTLAGGGWSRRIGDSLHCPTCDYECRYDDPSDFPIRCTECGTPWLGRFKTGRRAMSPKLIALGITLSFFSVVVMNPIFYMPLLGPHLPTPLLFSIRYAAPRSDFSSWSVLELRPLSPYWTKVMAERVLSHRAVDQHDRSPCQWLEAMVTANRLPADIADRFFRESFQAQLKNVPKHARIGEPFTAAPRVTQACDGKGDIGLMFAGYTLGDSAPLGRADRSHWSYELAPSVLQYHRDVLPQSLIADKRGDVLVHAVYWVSYQPSFMDELAWQPDGTAATPTNAMWFQRFELEQTVHVE